MLQNSDIIITLLIFGTQSIICLKMKKIESTLSRKLFFTHFILSLFVVVIHCANYFSMDRSSFDGNLFFVLEKTVCVFCDCAVPLFFAISAFLLFKDYELKKYPKLLLKKLFSLVIPYLLWSVIGLIYFEIILTAGAYSLNFLGTLKAILMADYNSPIWFIRPLLIFIACSPLFFFAYKYLRYFSLVIPIGFFILNLFVETPYSGPLFWLPIFFAGGALAFFDIKLELPKFKRSFACFSLLLLMIFALLIVLFDVGDKSLVYYFYRHASALMIWFGIDLFSFVYSKRPTFLFKNSRMLFFTHILVINVLNYIFTKLFSSYSYWVLFVWYLLKPMIVLTLVTTISYVLARYIPKLYGILSGEIKYLKTKTDVTSQI